MLALSLLLALAMETWLWLAVGHNLFQSGYGLLTAILVPLLLAVSWRALFVALGFALAGVWRRAEAGSRGERLRAWRGEFWAQLGLYTWLQPILAFERRPRAVHADAQPVVVLVHGFMCNSALWGDFAARLRRRGISRIYTVNLDPLYRDIERALAELHRKLGLILEREGETGVVLVGHSMGGLLARLYRTRHPQRVLAAAAIGAPHHGTAGARLIGGRERGPPSPASQWLQRFNSEHPLDAGLLNIWSEADNIVWPQPSARLDGARELKLTGYGHLHLLAAPVVLDAVVQLVHEARPALPEPACTP